MYTDYADFTDEHGKSKKSVEICAIRVIRVPKRVVSQPIVQWLVDSFGQNIGPRARRLANES